MSFSVLIIVKNRHEHLLRVLEGISQSLLQPSEVIIMHMNEATSAIDSPLPIKQFRLDSPHPLPLAAARNAAAQKATTEHLIFLDVDCIPAPDCFGQLLQGLQSSELTMADPRYLVNPVQELDNVVLESHGLPSPARANLALGASETYEMFWSLGFAISKQNFLKIGCFDEQYVGYGGEDTDFAFRARRSGLRLCYSAARIYHQNHPSYDPPLNWLEDIVTNSERFKEVWGVWPMQGWLNKFSDLGYITQSEHEIIINKLPTQSEIDAVQKSNAL